jgi:hypothetical protein
MVGWHEWWTEKIRKEAFMAYSGYFPENCLEGLRKITKDLRIADVPAKIQTERLPNTATLTRSVL